MKTLNLNTLSLSELESRYKIFAARAGHLCGMTLVKDSTGATVAVPLGQKVKEFFLDLVKGMSDPERLRQRNEFLARAQADPKTNAQLCALRIETFQNYVMANANIIPFFFNVVTLKDDEVPYHQNTTKQQIKVTFVGPHGTPQSVKVNPDPDETKIPLRWLSTDEVRYRTVDIYSGSIVDAALKTLMLADDMTQQMEAECFTLLTTAFATLTFTGKKATWPYLAHSRVKSANLPTTNDLDIAGMSGSTKFGFTTLDEIIDYGNRWGNALGGPLFPTGRILVASLHARDLAAGIVPTGSTSNKVADEILEQGWTSVGYMGKNWTIIADNTIDPANKFAYPEFNQKPGTVYLKPGLDREETVDTAELRKQGEQEKYMVKPFGAAINSVTRVRACRVQYTT